MRPLIPRVSVRVPASPFSLVIPQLNASSLRRPVSGAPARPHRRGALLLTLLLAAGCVPAVPRSPQLRPSATGTVQWIVEPGDVVRLRTFESSSTAGAAPTIVDNNIPVNERGEILLPNVGRVTVIGLTPTAVERTVVNSYAGRLDSTRVEVTFLRPLAVLGGVKQPGVQLAEPSASVVTLAARAGGPTRVGGDFRVFLLRPGSPNLEVSTADRVSELNVRSTDQLYIQDPSFAVRNEAGFRAIFEVVALITSSLTILFLITRKSI